MGINVKNVADHYIMKTDELKGNEFYFDFPSVGATINIMLAAILAKGKTIIYNAAKEPEIANVASFLS